MSGRHDPLELAIVAALGGAALLRRSWIRFQRARKVEDTPTSRAASAPQGRCELQGYAWPSTPMIAPVSGQPSVYLEIVVEERRGSGKNRRWVEIARAASRSPFFLVDSTGLVLVNPVGAETELTSRTQAWKSLGGEQIAHLLSFARSSGARLEDSGGGLFSSRRRVTERAIPVGSPLYAYGKFVTSDQGQGMSALLRPAIGLQRFAERMGLGTRVQPVPAARRRQAYRIAVGSLIAEPVEVPPARRPLELEAAGELRSLEDEPIFLADCPQAQLLERIGSWNLLCFVSGALLLGAAATVAYLRLTGVWRG